MKKFNFELVFFITGVFTTLLIFYVQGPYEKTQHYLIPLIPLGLVFVGLIIYRIFNIIYNSKTQYLLDQLKLINSTKINAKWVLQVLNTNGDLSVEKYHSINLLKNDTIKRTISEVIYSTNSLSNLPPDSKVENSNNTATKLKSKGVDINSVELDGVITNKYEWRYTIEPPLVKKGDYIEYSYKYLMPTETKKAFTDHGDIMCLENKNFAQKTSLTLIAPQNYSIEIIDVYIEDYEGGKSKIEDQRYLPKLNTKNKILVWETNYRHLSRFMCKFKFIKTG